MLVIVNIRLTNVDLIVKYYHLFLSVLLIVTNNNTDIRQL